VIWAAVLFAGGAELRRPGMTPIEIFVAVVMIAILRTPPDHSLRGHGMRLVLHTSHRRRSSMTSSRPQPQPN
jgi:hypothetical protein